MQRDLVERAMAGDHGAFSEPARASIGEVLDDTVVPHAAGTSDNEPEFLPQGDLSVVPADHERRYPVACDGPDQPGSGGSRLRAAVLPRARSADLARRHPDAIPADDAVPYRLIDLASGQVSDVALVGSDGATIDAIELAAAGPDRKAAGMSWHDDFDRSFSAWLTGVAPMLEPYGLLGQVLARTARTRRRRRGASLERSSPCGTDLDPSRVDVAGPAADHRCRRASHHRARDRSCRVHRRSAAAAACPVGSSRERPDRLQ